MMRELRPFQKILRLIKALVTVSGIGLASVSSTVCYAYHLPLWEFGLGAGVLNAPHYRGSKTVEVIYLPVPYLIYRGDFLKVDREGIRGELFESERLRLDISLAGNIPVPKTDNSARAGMPALDPVGEIGPELEIKLWDTATKNSDKSIELKIPFRPVFSVGNPLVEYQGWSLSPYINFELNMRKSHILMRYNLSIGPIFADRKYHNYFYQVDAKYQTAERDQYTADAGYSGSRITLTASRNSKKYFLGAFARYDNLSGAVFEDSPLVETRDYFIAGVAFAWIFSTSSESAKH